VDGIYDHASGLDAAALIGSTYRNLHNLFDKQSHKTFNGVPIDLRPRRWRSDGLAAKIGQLCLKHATYT
jgi:hypothetical protein